MNRIVWIALLAFGVLVAGTFLYLRLGDEDSNKTENTYPPPNTEEENIEAPKGALEKVSDPVEAEVSIAETVTARFWELEPGDDIRDVKNPALLRHYGADTGSGERDLKLVASLLQRFWLRFKNPDLMVVGSNADILASLTGRNPEAISFVSPNNRFLDAEGRLLDRWGETLFFHAESMTRIEIRSSGPDRDRFTEDDIVVVAHSSLRLR